jgi:hypothetical protein
MEKQKCNAGKSRKLFTAPNEAYWEGEGKLKTNYKIIQENLITDWQMQDKPTLFTSL